MRTKRNAVTGAERPPVLSKAAIIRARNEQLARDFWLACMNADMPTAEREVRFVEGRKWAFDFAWPSHGVALEVEGGVWTQGRHTRGSGFVKDMEKYNAATLEGWRVVRCTPATLCGKSTLDMIATLLQGRKRGDYPR